MDDEQRHCPECDAAWNGGSTCQGHFYQMLAWESEYPPLGVVHHLMVLTYHLQHPSLYSPEGVQHGMALLHEFVDLGMPPQEARRRHRDEVNSGNRKWRITARPGAQGAYPKPVRWAMTTTDVIAGGPDLYIERVEQWARSTLADLRASCNYSPG